MQREFGDMSSTMIRPWKIIRIVLWSFFAWFFLALLWAFLPFPSFEREGDNGNDYATSVLRAGQTLNRVYPYQKFKVSANRRSAFALDYTFDENNFALSISGWHKPIPIISTTLEPAGAEEEINVSARTGDVDGANLPWFEYADAILLYWWLQKDTIDMSVIVHRSETTEAHILDLQIPGGGSLLSIQMMSSNSTIIATVPARPDSSSPSLTYPIRIVLIHIVAPIAIFIDVVAGIFLEVFGNAFGVLFVIGVYGFVILAIIISLWRCLRGPSLEDTVERVQSHLEEWKENERLRFLPLNAIQERLEQGYRNERVRSFLNICANGWHPEREAARIAEEEQTDIEKVGNDSDKI